ncbi:methylated-DNA--[protein]-cysteine S-methyltransferase [Actinomyces minihominis]|uniref:methylated-DNA--[protein]-cysteine S-methyltransferase n=1 Tax=Actinomyces minihominis TaxID=2002838 RepID=UPI001A928EC5|nr:methylated-DNA--[protein]-cysteine S-methyltransferase [Actinomyces minihominis]
MKKTPLPVTPLVHKVIASPVGLVLALASRRGLVKIQFHPESLDRDSAVLTLSGNAQSNPGNRDHPGYRILEQLQTQLGEYGRGERRTFALALDLLPTFDVEDDAGLHAVPNPWVSAHGRFRQQVQVALQSIPYGETASYGEVATAVGTPGAARAVGTACATNPLPIILPCHRVTRSDGTLGEYTGGVAIKEALLKLERDNCAA